MNNLENKVRCITPGFVERTDLFKEKGRVALATAFRAKENEANFMACLTTMNHPNPYFKYVGYTFALKYCLGEVNQTDPCEAQNIIGMLNLGIIKNYREVNKFWEEHENPLEPFFKIFYGGYLKANNQPQGIESYNYVVALLVNYFEGEHQL